MWGGGVCVHVGGVGERGACVRCALRLGGCVCEEGKEWRCDIMLAIWQAWV